MPCYDITSLTLAVEHSVLRNHSSNGLVVVLEASI